MKTKLFFAFSITLLSAAAIYFAACKKDVIPAPEATQTTTQTEAVADRTAPFCSVRISAVSGGSTMSVCGFGFNGECARDCSNHPLYGTSPFGKFSVTSFPKEFAVTNTGSTAGSVNISWACGEYFCGGSLNAVVIPANSSKVFIINNNGSVCSCQEYLCE